MSNVHDFGAAGDGKADDTDAIQHAIDDGDGLIEFPRGDYRITRTLTVDLTKRSRTSIHGSNGVAKLIMAGPGPAIHFKGTHAKTADPAGFKPAEWADERMPVLSGIEIEGAHMLADGVRIEGVMQPQITGVLIREVNTAVHVTSRARNLIIDHCNFYHNRGVGVHLDGVNLHQTIISSSHISYCRLGGIRIEKSEIRNLQITGNDIEYNNYRSHPDVGQPDDPTAEIYIDTSDPASSVREGTISSNTIQATYSKGGANIRFTGGTDGARRAGMWTITGNLIGSQEVNVHLTSARGVVLTGNYIYSGHHRNLLVEDSRNIVVGDNCFGHNPDYKNNGLATCIEFRNSESCNLTGLIIEDATGSTHTVPGAPPLVRQALLEMRDCRQMTLTGLQVLDGAPYGMLVENCSNTVMTGCQIHDRRTPQLMQRPLIWKGDGTGNLISGCSFGNGTAGGPQLPEKVTVANNL